MEEIKEGWWSKWGMFLLVFLTGPILTAIVGFTSNITDESPRLGVNPVQLMVCIAWLLSLLVTVPKAKEQATGEVARELLFVARAGDQRLYATNSGAVLPVIGSPIALVDPEGESYEYAIGVVRTVAPTSHVTAKGGEYLVEVDVEGGVMSVLRDNGWESSEP